ncbi:hypothetical protein CN692_21945 [Bacillus sp. AFS002410]|uniref:ATP-binding cassette domain-containing protein n=1 Tax=Bacillus sp. AFS002410 TaxID=2033481 RepID=UPI000BF0C79D|nr:ABC transporter ATP-binding protein [Bacillus sp. AFS002410]PEJ52376.1 hypothetical protein CN692_21945 [Bacillus sp. AFS002410]
MLELRDVTIKYEEKYILNKINFQFDTNKIYGLIGKNGSGKTTLLKTIMRLKKESSGDLLLDNTSINHTDYFDLDATFISDEHSLFQDLTMYEQMLFLCRLKGYKKEIARQKIDEIVGLFKLEEYVDYFPYALSRGTIQRFAIVFGCLRASRLLLLDEPFITLDPVQVNILEEMLISQKSKDKIIIVSSHDIDSLEEICNEYLIIKDSSLLSFAPNELNRQTISKLIGDSYD